MTIENLTDTLKGDEATEYPTFLYDHSFLNREKCGYSEGYWQK
jgi:hypothetical protein